MTRTTVRDVRPREQDCCMEPGEAWAYRARGIDPLVEVRVIKIGTQRPARVFVRFVADKFEGKEEWVPPARLKVLWSGVEELRVSEDLWNKVSALGPIRDEPREDAAQEVLDEFLPRDLAWINNRSGSSLSIAQPAELALRLELTLETLTGSPETFVENGVTVAPWPITELIAQRVAEQNAEELLKRIEQEERKARRDSIHGYNSGRRNSFFIKPEWSAEWDAKYDQPRRKVIRDWCGAENVERFDELVELRKEIKRVGDVAQSAIDSLRRHGHVTEATHLANELGTPVEMLRVDQNE